MTRDFDLYSVNLIFFTTIQRLRLNGDLDDLGDLGDLCSILGFFTIYCFYFHKNVKIKQRNDDTSEKMQN